MAMLERICAYRAHAQHREIHNQRLIKSPPRPDYQQLSTTLFHLGFDRWLESFSKEPNERGLLWGSVSIKLNQDSLEVLKVRSSILNLLLLVLRVSYKFAPDAVHEKP